MTQAKRAPHLDIYPWFDTVQEKRPSPWGTLWAGLFALSAWLTGAVISYFITSPSQRVVTIVWLGIIFLVLLALITSKFLDQLTQEDGFDALRKDPRPPVVYLRSFYEDNRTFYDPKFLAASKTREEAMSEAMRGLGPFVAIGKPGEGQVRIGAARLYVTGAHWQQVVASLVEHAAAIILQPDDTPGTRWEISAVAGLGDLRRVLLLVPNPAARPLGYERVRQAAAQFLPPLPADPGACDAFVFEDGATPRALSFAKDHDSETAYFFVRQIRKLETAGV